MTGSTIQTVRVLLSGRVQGVGFRYWTQLQAEARGLDGWVRNLRDGRVEAVFQGPAGDVEAMIEACRSGPPVAKVAEVRRFEAAPLTEEGFILRPSAMGPET